MALPAPNLDDRRFQQFVDDGKRLVQQKCPEWTDHNVSDPGVTLIEIFAWMADQLVHRLNQVPDRLYVKFLELLGVELAPPVAAHTDVTFWLSAPQPEPVSIARGTEVATVRTETEPAVVFTVTKELAVVPSSLAHIASSAGGVDQWQTEALGFEGFAAFSAVPQPGDALLIGLSSAVPSCAVTLRFDCDVAEGHGVDPRNPPLTWEAMVGEDWAPCVVGRDETGGLNRPGEVILHVPETHILSALSDRRAGWLRCRVVETTEGQRAYGGSPRIRKLTAFTSGGTAPARNAELITDELLGASNGVPGQRYPLKHRPVILVQRTSLEVRLGDAHEEWTEVESFEDSGPADRHFRIDRMAGEVVFGPMVREPDGTPSYYGAVPAPNAELRIREYATGGGASGNVAAGAIKMLRSSIPYVARLENRLPARGGVDGEDIENAKVRGPMLLRGTRAVAARDFEHQAIQAAPNEVARVLCLPAGGGSNPGDVRVLITPAVEDDDLGRLPFAEISRLDEALHTKIKDHLDRRRLVGVRVLVEPPLYMGLTIEARVHAGPRSDPKLLHDAAVEALYRYFHPISGGADGRGWPFGRPVHAGEAFWVLQRIPGVLFVEDAQLIPSNPITGQRGDPVRRLELERDALVFSYEHVVDVITETSA